MKLLLGALFWIAAVVLGAWVCQAIPEEMRFAFERSQSELWRGIFEPAPRHTVRFRGDPPLWFGDGVFVLRDRELIRVGEVCGRDFDDHSNLIAAIKLDPGSGCGVVVAGSRVVHRTQAQSFLYCMQTLLDREKRQEIQVQWERFRALHERRLLAILRPLVPQLLGELGDFLEAELARSLERHAEDLKRWSSDRRAVLTQEQLLPLLSQEIWPLAREALRPVTETVGRELWERAPLFDLAWRAAYDAMLADRPNKLEVRWKAFVQEEAIPVLRQHESEIQSALAEVLRRVAEDPEVQQGVQDIARSLLADRELHSLGRKVLHDLFVDNDRWRTFVEEKLLREEVRRRLLLANDELQVFFNELGNLIFFAGDRETMNPDLAKVLRLLLLRRDQRFLFLELGTGEPLASGEELLGVWG